MVPSNGLLATENPCWSIYTPKGTAGEPVTEQV